MCLSSSDSGVSFFKLLTLSYKGDMCCLPVLFVLNWTGVLFAVPPLRSTVTHFRDTGFTFVQKLCFCNVKCQLADRRSFVLIVEILDSHSHFENIDSSCVVDFQKIS